MENVKIQKKNRGGAFLHDSLLAEKANRKNKKGGGLHRPKNTPYKRSSVRVNARNWNYDEEEDYDYKF